MLKMDTFIASEKTYASHLKSSVGVTHYRLSNMHKAIRLVTYQGNFMIT